jgi:hypothetical protein
VESRHLPATSDNAHPCLDYQRSRFSCRDYQLPPSSSSLRQGKEVVTLHHQILVFNSGIHMRGRLHAIPATLSHYVLPSASSSSQPVILDCRATLLEIPMRFHTSSCHPKSSRPRPHQRESKQERDRTLVPSEPYLNPEIHGLIHPF